MNVDYDPREGQLVVHSTNPYIQGEETCVRNSTPGNLTTAQGNYPLYRKIN
jgi:hypothetical protein